LDKINEIQGDCEEEFVKSKKLRDDIKNTQENIEKKLNKMEKRSKRAQYNF